ncbi:MAG: 50S ribosomal protein L21 [Candidatus Caenarcaniphilales bacterium]|nr:50S ribosomal protein L21 [Candidatus Caenarcaniphilales bacterium]
MFAYVKHSGKQFKVAEGAIITVDKIAVDAGSEVTISDIPLLVKDDNSVVSSPKGSVVCEVIKHGRSKKVLVLKQRPKKGYKRKKGHRQEFTQLKVQSIEIV